MKLKVDIKSRMKNPWFWAGILSVICVAIGANPESFTTWQSVWEQAVHIASNPFLLITVVLAVLGQFVDPSTPGFCDHTKEVDSQND